jgi:hypothetical protein
LLVRRLKSGRCADASALTAEIVEHFSDAGKAEFVRIFNGRCHDTRLEPEADKDQLSWHHVHAFFDCKNAIAISCEAWHPICIFMVLQKLYFRCIFDFVAAAYSKFFSGEVLPPK